LTVYGDGSQTRSLCYVSDTVEGLLRLMFSEETGPVNLGSPEEISMKELAEKIIQITETSSSILFEPLPRDDPNRRCPDISKAISRLSWRPRVTLREGLTEVVPYFRSKVKKSSLITTATNLRPHAAVTSWAFPCNSSLHLVALQASVLLLADLSFHVHKSLWLAQSWCYNGA
jgi:UDP-glucuronate decarboxylase